MLSLELVWYFIIGISVIFYVILDGFDLGVGMLHLCGRKDEERRVFLNAIGPVWDGNEVWLIIVAGGLFAGFPDVYATLFSSFYNICMFLLLGLIFRAVAIEFRSKRPSKRWRSTWDVTFCIASGAIAWGLGFVLGNLVEGIPLDEHKDFAGTFSDFFSLYTVLFGFVSMALFMMHGALYLLVKTEGDVQEHVRMWTKRVIYIFIALYALVSVATIMWRPHMIERLNMFPWAYLLPIAALLCILNIPRLVSKKKDGSAFIFSCGGIALLFILFGVGTFPVLVRSTLNPEVNSLTFMNSASSPLTLKVLLLIVAIGVPLVLAYGWYIYRTFRGKVKLGPSSY